jgi:spore maturation protein CgeB
MHPSLQLFTASSGKLSAKVAFGNNVVRHLHSTVRPEAEAELNETVSWYGDLIVFAGIGLGWHVRNALSGMPAHARCVVIDHFEECIRHASEVLFAGLPNHLLFVSAEYVERSRSGLASFVAAARPGSLQIVKHPASFDCFRDFYESLLYDIARQFVQRRPKRTLAARKAMTFFGNFFLEEEVRRALVQGKIEPVLFDYKKYASGNAFESGLSRLLQKEDPDFILSINMKGFDGNGETGRTAERLGVPLVIWFVDDPRPILLNNRKHVRPKMTALCWEKEHIPFLRDAGFATVEYLPLACDPGMFSGASRTRSPGANVTTSLGFVGTSMVDRFAGAIRDKFLWSDGLLPLVNDVCDTLLSNPAFQVYGSLPEQAKKLGIPLPFSDDHNLTWLAAYIIHQASMRKRRSIVSGLFSLGIETFGDPDGWRELFGNTVVTHPNIDYRHELGSVYQRIAVNVNITSCQMPTSVNQRVFDIPMVGGFVISDDQKDLHELFDQPEIATYETIEDLQEKVRFYLANESARLKITGLAQKRILGEHTYVHRMQKIISLL